MPSKYPPFLQKAHIKEEIYHHPTSQHLGFQGLSTPKGQDLAVRGRHLGVSQFTLCFRYRIFTKKLLCYWLAQCCVTGILCHLFATRAVSSSNLCRHGGPPRGEFWIVKHWRCKKGLGSDPGPAVWRVNTTCLRPPSYQFRAGSSVDCSIHLMELLQGLKSWIHVYTCNLSVSAEK